MAKAIWYMAAYNARRSPFVYGEKNTENLQSGTDLVLNPAESVRNWFVSTCKVGYGNMKLRSTGLVFS